jgi:hypothetical protein
MAGEDQLKGPGITTSSGSGTGSNTTQFSFNRGSIKYDTPFLDMTSTFLPRYIKSILRFVAAYVMGDGLVSQCVTKMAEYPITDLLYNEDEKSSLENDKTVEKWKFILEEKMKVMRSLKQGGMDYYAYGNSIVSINYPFKRMLDCPRCKASHSADALKYKFRGFAFYADCIEEKCNYKGKMEARDINTKEVSRLGLVHWDLLYMDIKYNSISGDHFYFYTIPPDLGASIRRGDMDMVGSTRLEIIRAIQKRKQLKLKNDNVFHLKRAAPQYMFPSERGWGIPVVMPVMKDIFHCKILKKGNEMIAFDHIVPLRILFPQGTGDVSPHATINLGGWRTKIEDEIRKWRADPNYISIVPLPVGMQNFSGDSKILSVTPEIKATEDTIITGIGIIPEIIRGGASWSGSNVSLRVVENTFINHRTDSHSFLNWVIDGVHRHMDMPKVNVRMSDFKMADDLEKKKLMVDAARGRRSEALVSRTTATKELGFDPKEEYTNRSDELKEIIELQVREAEGDAEAGGMASLINATYQADSELELQDRMEKHQRESQGKRDEEFQVESDENASSVQEEVAQLAEQKGTRADMVNLPNLILNVTQRFMRLLKIDPDEYKARMLAMKNSMPYLYNEILKNLKEMNLIEADTSPNLATAQESTPGELPSYSQGDQHASEPPSPAEVGANPSVIQSTTPSNNGAPKALPEARPPRSETSAPV